MITRSVRRALELALDMRIPATFARAEQITVLPGPLPRPGAAQESFPVMLADHLARVDAALAGRLPAPAPPRGPTVHIWELLPRTLVYAKPGRWDLVSPPVGWAPWPAVADSYRVALVVSGPGGPWGGYTVEPAPTLRQAVEAALVDLDKNTELGRNAVEAGVLAYGWVRSPRFPHAPFAVRHAG